MTIGTISSSQNSALSFLKTATSSASSQFASSQSASSQQNSNLKQSLLQLESGKQDLNAERKAAAQEKIERLKAQLQALRLMAASNPKAAAREAARLSRELAQAAREYASAVGSGTGDSVLSAGSAASAMATAAAAAPAAQAAPEAEATAEAAPVAEGESAAVAGTTKTEEQAQRDEFRQGLDEKLAAINKRAAEGRADAEFVREARRIQNELKMIVKRAKRALEDDKDSAGAQDIKSAENALRETGSTLNDIAMGTAPASISIFV